MLAPFDEFDKKVWEETDGHLSLLEPIEQLRGQYDFIVFDCPPRLSLVSFAALVASDFVIVPLEAADWGAQGIGRVGEAVEYVRRRFNPQLQLLGYLVSRYKAARTYQQTYLAELRRHFGPLVFDTLVADLAGFERSVTDAVPLLQHNPTSRAASIARRFYDEV